MGRGQQDVGWRRWSWEGSWGAGERRDIVDRQGWGRALGSWRWRGPEFWAGQMLNAQIHWAMGGGGGEGVGVKGRRKTRIPWLEGSRGCRQNST